MNEWGKSNSSGQRATEGMSDEEKREIAALAANMVIERLLLEYGKASWRLTLIVIGFGVLALLAWLGLHKAITIT